MNPVEIIRKKRDGSTLTGAEIDYFISNYVKGEIPDYQKSALLMAIYFRGLSDEETLGFVKAYIDSGNRINLSHIKKPKIDKHSTGGVGDKTSLILAPLIACFDVVVPMMSGRGLGHTGGTLDKLESIPGFNVHLSNEEFIRNLQRLGVSMIGQTDDLTPADKKIYALRDVTATVESVGLITASITSKKIAEGAEGIVYDVKVGSGSTLPTLEKSKELARNLIKTSKDFGQTAIAVLTDMNSPLGYSIGNWAEVAECIEIMDPARNVSTLSKDLLEVTLFLAGAMLNLAGKSDSIEYGVKLAGEKLVSGECFGKFIELTEMQGGNTAFIKEPGDYPKPGIEKDIKTSEKGYITRLDARAFGLAAVDLGCGRKKVEDKIDYSSAIILNKKPGDPIAAGETICTIHGESPEQVESAIKIATGGISISSTKTEAESRIIEVIT